MRHATYRNRTLDDSYGSTHGAGFPNTVYVCLYIAGPTDLLPGTEVTGGAYAPAAVPNTTPFWPNAVGSLKVNGAPITFVRATTAWTGPITHWVIKDAPSGTIIDSGEFDEPFFVIAGQTATLDPGAIVIEVKNAA